MIVDHRVAVVAVVEAVPIDPMIDRHFTVIVHNLVTEMIEDSAVAVEVVVVVAVAAKEEVMVVDNVTMGNVATAKAVVAEVEEIIVVMEAIEQVMVEAVTEVVMVALEEIEVVDLAVDSAVVDEVVTAALIHVNLKVHQEPSQKTSKSSQTISK
jgi:hypothetical protein